MFVVIEFMIDSLGNPGSFAFTYDNIAEAKAKYHTILAAAALSNTKVHSATILTEELYQIEKDFARHDLEE